MTDEGKYRNYRYYRSKENFTFTPNQGHMGAKVCGCWTAEWTRDTSSKMSLNKTLNAQRFFVPGTRRIQRQRRKVLYSTVHVHFPGWEVGQSIHSSSTATAVWLNGATGGLEPILAAIGQESGEHPGQVASSLQGQHTETQQFTLTLKVTDFLGLREYLGRTCKVHIIKPLGTVGPGPPCDRLRAMPSI